MGNLDWLTGVSEISKSFCAASTSGLPQGQLLASRIIPARIRCPASDPLTVDGPLAHFQPEDLRGGSQPKFATFVAVPFPNLHPAVQEFRRLAYGLGA